MGEREEHNSVHWHNFRVARSKMAGMSKSEREAYAEKVRQGLFYFLISQVIADASIKKGSA